MGDGLDRFVTLLVFIAGALVGAGISGYVHDARKPKQSTPKAGRWILHDVVCPESYECSVCHKWYELDKNEDCDVWAYCPCCGSPMIRVGGRKT